MSDKIIFDASAILSLVNREKGYEVAETHLNNAIVSSVNISEVITVINRIDLSNRNGFTNDEMAKILKMIFPHIIDFDYEQACVAASLDQLTKQYGLSFGDRACLALAKYKNLPVLTADKVWKNLDVGIKIQLIR